MSEFQTISINQKRFNYVLDPDVIINHNHEIIEYFYKANETDKVGTYETITVLTINKLADIRLDSFDSVSCCKTNDCSFLVILGSDSQHIIHVVFYNLNSKTASHVPLKQELRSKLIKATITRSSSKVMYRDKRDAPLSSDSFVLVIATQEEGVYVVFISFDETFEFTTQSMESFPMKDAKIDDPGYVTSICILPTDHSDTRMGHGDPQVILGFSLGHILNFRIRANVYYHNAERVRAPKNLSDFVDFPGYPVTKLSCARSYNSLETITAFAQEKPAQISDKTSYVKLIQSYGDGFSKVKKTIHASGPSVNIIESELIPSATTGNDDQIQLSILFLDHENSIFKSSIWDIAPGKIEPQPVEEILNLSMDYKQCIRSIVGRTRTHLEKDKFLTNSPQKVILTILTNQVSKKREATFNTVEDAKAQSLRKKRRTKKRTTNTLPLAPQSISGEAPANESDLETVDPSSGLYSTDDVGSSLFDSMGDNELTPSDNIVFDDDDDVFMRDIGTDANIDSSTALDNTYDDDNDYINDEVHFDINAFAEEDTRTEDDTNDINNQDTNLIDQAEESTDIPVEDSTDGVQESATTSASAENITAHDLGERNVTDAPVEVNTEGIVNKVNAEEVDTATVNTKEVDVEEADTEEIDTGIDETEQTNAEQTDIQQNDIEVDNEQASTGQVNTEEGTIQINIEQADQLVDTEQLDNEHVNTEEVNTEKVEDNTEQIDFGVDDTKQVDIQLANKEEMEIEQAYEQADTEQGGNLVDTVEIVEKSDVERIIVDRAEVEQNDIETEVAEHTEDEQAEPVKSDIEIATMEQVDNEAAEPAEIPRIDIEKMETKQLDVEQQDADVVDMEELDTEAAEAEQADLETDNIEQTDTEQVDVDQLDMEQTDTDLAETERVEVGKASIEQDDIELDDNEHIDTERANTQQTDVEEVDMEEFDAEVVDTEPKETQRVDIETDDTEQINAERDIAQAGAHQTNIAEVDLAQLDTDPVDTEPVHTPPVDVEQVDDDEVDDTQQTNTEADIGQEDTAQASTHQNDAEEVDMEQFIAEQDGTGPVESQTTDVERVDIETDDTDVEQLNTEEPDTEQAGTDQNEAEVIDMEEFDIEEDLAEMQHEDMEVATDQSEIEPSIEQTEEPNYDEQSQAEPTDDETNAEHYIEQTGEHSANYSGAEPHNVQPNSEHRVEERSLDQLEAEPSTEQSNTQLDIDQSEVEPSIEEVDVETEDIDTEIHTVETITEIFDHDHEIVEQDDTMTNNLVNNMMQNMTDLQPTVNDMMNDMDAGMLLASLIGGNAQPNFDMNTDFVGSIIDTNVLDNSFGQPNIVITNLDADDSLAVTSLEESENVDEDYSDMVSNEDSDVVILSSDVDISATVPSEDDDISVTHDEMSWDEEDQDAVFEQEDRQVGHGFTGYAAYNRVAEISGNRILYSVDSSNASEADAPQDYGEEEMNDIEEILRVSATHDAESSAQSMSEVQTQDSASTDGQDLFDKVIPEMLLELFGTSQLDIEQLSPDQLDSVGNYCWTSSNPQLKLFMLRFVYSRNMYEAVVLLGRELINSKSLSGDDLEECKSIFRKSLFQVHPFIRSSEPLNPFDKRVKDEIVEQKNNYYIENNSTNYLSTKYTDYYSFGYQ